MKSKGHAHFPKILAQHFEYLAALWSDLDEKLSRWIKTLKIVILKARGPGKFCSKRLNGTKVGEMDQIFRKVPSGERYLNFLGPAGGSRTRNGAFALQDNITWLVETEIAFSVEEQHFIGTTAGQIHFKSACGFSENFGTKS